MKFKNCLMVFFHKFMNNECMNLKNICGDGNSSFSNLRVARLLLRVLALGGGIFLFLAFVILMGAALNNEVWQIRRHMNAAMFEAKTYLDEKEILLEHLARNIAVKNEGLGYLLSDDQPVYISIGAFEKKLSIFLAPEDIKELNQKKLNLFYIDYESEKKIFTLHNGGNKEDALSRKIINYIDDEDFKFDNDDFVWMSDNSSERSKIFILKKIKNRDGVNWLGLQISMKELEKTLQYPDAGHYVLINKNAEVVLGDSFLQNIAKNLRANFGTDYFGFDGGQLLDSRLILVKHVGASDWSLIYYYDFKELLLPLIPKLLFGFLIIVTGFYFLYLLHRTLHKRLIIPEQRRICSIIENDNFSRTIIQTAPVALCVLRRRDAEVALENRLAQKWLGSGEVRRAWSSGWIENAFEFDDTEHDREIITPTGKNLLLSFSAASYSGEDVLCCAFSDISERKQTEEALEMAKKLSDEANQAKTLFLATMSHEIRTPLHGLLGTIELLSRTILNSQQEGYLRALQRSSSTLLQLINDVLDVSKIEARELKLNKSVFSPAELTLDIVSSFAASARAKGVYLYACIDPSVPGFAQGDDSRIRQILNNLISNAVKFTDHGRIVMRVKSGVRTENSVINLNWQISDTGAGIAIENQKFLFDPFFQVSENSKNTPGTGLGLSICKRLADLMQGELRVVSDVGLGSSFTLNLPLEKIKLDEDINEKLLDKKILVHTPVKELTENFCAWIEYWGGHAQVFQMNYQNNDDCDAVLLELRFNSCQQIPFSAWKDSKVIVSDLGGDQPRKEGLEWHIGRFNLKGIFKALSLAQNNSAGITSNSYEFFNDDKLSLNILVVEDNPINQMVIRDQLEIIGCSAILASDATEALKIWRNKNLDLIITDVNMPGISGFDFAKQLRNMECNLPIIVTTANVMPEDEDMCKSIGIQKILTKPINIKTLYSCLLNFSMEKK